MLRMIHIMQCPMQSDVCELVEKAIRTNDYVIVTVKA